MSKLALVLAVTVAAASPSWAQPKQPPKGAATPADALATLDGFKVELLASSDAKTPGSWINLGKDN